MLAPLLAVAPAIPNDVGGKYVAGAYIVFVLLLLIYVAIMGMKLARIERDLSEIAAIAEARKAELSAAETAPGRGSQEPSMSDSLAPGGSRGSGA
jgi:Tfp pilus assembly protein PilX